MADIEEDMTQITNEPEEEVEETPVEEPKTVAVRDIPFEDRLYALRVDGCQLDWVKDTPVDMGAKGSYRARSAEKVMAETSPLFAKHGIDFRPDFQNLQVFGTGPNQKWAVTLEMTLKDYWSDKMVVMHFYGEGDFNSGRGLRMAHTFALKQGLLAYFLGADGIDMEGVIESKKYTPLSEEEKVEVKSKLQDMAVAPAPAPAPVAKPTGVAPKESAPPAKSFKLAPLQANAINKIVEVWNKELEEGKMDQATYDERIAQKDALSSAVEVSKFIQTYRV